MAEQEKKDISTSIEAKIIAAKGITLGDDLVNPLEKALLKDILEKHGEELADTQEATSINLAKLVDDIADLSEGNQPLLQEVAKMLDVELTQKNKASQMNYKLFQKILKFQKEHNISPLTGRVDKKLYLALKKHTEKKKTTTPESAETATQQNKTPATPTQNKPSQSETDGIPAPPIPDIPQAIPVGPEVPSNPSNTTQQYEGQNERILPPTVPAAPAGIPSVGAEAGVQVGQKVTTSVGVKTPVETTPTKTEEKPTVKALPVEEAAEKTEEVKKVISEEGKKLGITINGLEISESPLGQEIVDMILYYESGEDYMLRPGSRQPDDPEGTFDIGGGINTGSDDAEKKYVLGNNYSKWNDNFIPTENIRECVLRLLNVRIALTKANYENKCGVKDFDTLPQNVKAVLVDLHYNMPNTINEFTKFWKAIKKKNWQEAGLQLVDNGKGGPSGYAADTGGRAYANALGLSTGDISNYRKNKEEVEKMSSEALLDHYIQKVGEYGKKVDRGEQKDIVKNAQNTGDILTQTTSTDVLRSKGSTKSITKILDSYIKGEGLTQAQQYQRREEVIQALKNQIGNFQHPLRNNEEVGAFQQLVYLTDPEGFKQLEYIDGENDTRTQQAFDTLSKSLDLKK